MICSDSPFPYGEADCLFRPTVTACARPRFTTRPFRMGFPALPSATAEHHSGHITHYLNTRRHGSKSAIVR